MCTVVPVHDATRPKRVLFQVLACEKEEKREREGEERNERRRRRKKKEVRGRQRIGKEEKGKGLPPLLGALDPNSRGGTRTRGRKNRREKRKKI